MERGLLRVIIDEDEDILTREDLEAVQRGLDDVKNGRVYTLLEGESLSDMLDRRIGQAAETI